MLELKNKTKTTVILNTKEGEAIYLKPGLNKVNKTPIKSELDVAIKSGLVKVVEKPVKKIKEPKDLKEVIDQNKEEDDDTATAIKKAKSKLNSKK